MKHEQLVLKLKAMAGKAGSQFALAQQLHVSTSYLSEVIRGTRQPGKAILSALGLEAFVFYRKVKQGGIDGE